MGCVRIIICAVGAALALFLGFCRWCFMVQSTGPYVNPRTAAAYCFLWAAVAVLWLVLGVGGRLRSRRVLLGAATVTVLVLAFLHWRVFGIQVLNASIRTDVDRVTVYNHNAIPMTSTAVEVDEGAAIPVGGIAPGESGETHRSITEGGAPSPTTFRVTCVLGLYGRQEEFFANRPHQ